MNYDNDAWGRSAGRADADREVIRQHPELARATPAGAQQVAGGGTAEQQLDRLARQISGGRHVSYAQAYCEALNSKPALYLQFVREHETALRARQG